MHDLAIVITSLNEAHWLRSCLASLVERQAGADVEFVVVDIASTDDTVALLEREFRQVRVIRTENLGFSHANNRGFLATDARYVLFLNPDTEWVEGDLASAIRAMDERPEVGVIGCRQLTPAGALYPTSRRFRNAIRILAEAMGSERLLPRAGHRILSMDLYEHEFAPDWVIGSFMLCRREALLSGGCLDERYFLYSEEEDLCRRIRLAGWDIRHIPDFAIVHHVGKAGIVPRLEAQRAFASLQYAHRHEGRVGRCLMRVSLTLGYTIRLLRSMLRRDERSREAFLSGLRIILGLDGPPFITPPSSGLAAGAVADVQRQMNH